MNWQVLLQPALPALLKLLEIAPGPTNDNDAAERMAAVIDLSRHALALAKIPLPSHSEVQSLVEQTMNQMKAEGLLAGSTAGDASGLQLKIVGEVDEPTSS